MKKLVGGKGLIFFASFLATQASFADQALVSESTVKIDGFQSPNNNLGAA